MKCLIQSNFSRFMAALLVLAGMTLVAAVGCGSKGSSGLLIAPITSANERLSEAELIVRATFIDSAIHPRPIISPVDNQAHGQVTEVFNRFEVIEALKGDFEAGKPVFVSNTKSSTAGRTEGGSASNLSYSRGAEYVLFLESRPAYETDPEEYGPLRWHVAGHPGAARLDGDRVLFMLSDEYAELFEERGVEFPDPDSEAPFLMTLSGIREKTGTNS